MPIDEFRVLREECAARIVALVNAISSIPEDLQPVARARVVAVREQIYFGWERPMAAARGTKYFGGKYEIDGWWSVDAAAFVNSGRYTPRSRQLEREHVEPMSKIVADLLAAPRSPAQTADFLDERIVTCTVLAAEHRALAKGSGWERYELAGIRVQKGLTPASVAEAR